MRPPAEAIASLAWVVAAIAAIIFVIVEGTLLVILLRARAWRRASSIPQTEGNTRLEIAWTAAPVLALGVVAVLMLGVMREIGVSRPAGVPGDEPAVVIDAIGHQFWWEYRYGEVVVPNELHIPVGVPVELRLTTRDVIHSWWVPELGGKLDMVPGKTNGLRLYARTPGTYLGQCGEFCGMQHAWMRIRVVAMPRADFDRWLADQARPRVEPAGLAAEGERVFRQKVCVSCHAVRGAATSGVGGPDLTHMRSRATIGAGVLPNRADTMRAWLADTQYWKAGVLMPNVPLSDRELDALVAYMESLR